jgi:hypothetical protein
MNLTAWRTGKKYFDLAKPEYQDLSPIFKLVKEVLPQK